MFEPHVSIIIVNLNGRQYLNDCLTSVFNQRYKNFEVILVDNGSTDNSLDFVRNNFVQVKIIALDRNYGFAKGNNIGIKEGLKNKEVKYIALLNNDTRVDSNWLAELIKAISADEKIGIYASKILMMDKPKVLDSTGHIFAGGIIVDRGNNQIDQGQYDRKPEVIGACAAACIYRREMLEAIGLFDEDFISYYEDAELSWRAYKSGWKAKFVPQALVYHREQGTIRQDKNLESDTRSLWLLNLVRMIRRHATFKQKLWITLIWFKDIYRIRLFFRRLKLLWFQR